MSTTGIGLTFAINNRLVSFALVVPTLVCASVAVYEMVGPISAHFALVRAGEAGRSKTPARDPMII